MISFDAFVFMAIYIKMKRKTNRTLSFSDILSIRYLKAAKTKLCVCVLVPIAMLVAKSQSK